MSDQVALFRVQFDRLMEEIKRGICLELDTKARALFALLQEELLRQLLSATDDDDQENAVVVTGDDLNESDEIVFCRFQEDGADSVSVSSECDCDSAQEEEYDVKVEPEDEDDRGEAGDGDDNENSQDEADNHVSRENTETNVDADSECDYDSELDDDIEVKEELIDADQGETEERENPSDQVVPIASTSSGLCRSSRKSIKRKDFTPDDAATSDDEESDRERYGAERQRKSARVDATSAVRTEANHEDIDEQVDSKQVITRYLNCTVSGCVKKKKDKAKLKKHLKTKHGVYLDRCHVRGCKATFPDRYQIGDHLGSAHSTLTIWPCEICTVECTSYHNLNNHVWFYHEQGHFACGYTGCIVTSYINRKKVIDHYRHHKPATHQCTFTGCGKAFKNSSHLKNHLVTHTGEKAFNCVICNSAFTQKSVLTRHLKTQTHRLNAERAAAAAAN